MPCAMEGETQTSLKVSNLSNVTFALAMMTDRRQFVKQMTLRQSNNLLGLLMFMASPLA